MTVYSVSPLDLAQGIQPHSFIYQDYLKPVENPHQADSGNLAVQVLASQSGGLAFDPSGDLSVQLNRCLADTSAYYELSFDSAPDGKADEYHAIDIQVTKNGLKARTNSVYYSEP